MIMTLPGMPLGWAVAIFVGMGLILVIGMAASPPTYGRTRFLNLANVPVIGVVTRYLTRNPWPIIFLKYFSIAVFIVVIISGLFGTPVAKLNFATVITWNLWWTLVVISVFFVGSAWCSFCPWDALANLLVKGRIWWRPADTAGLELVVPRYLRNTWPALIMLVGLTWFELGMGATVDPMATATLAMFMVVIAVLSLVLFQRKAFCRYFCPVGRTIGSYSQLSPIEIRPVDADICAKCSTLECFFGTDSTEPCPTNLTMGRFAQNTYCTSCGACAVGCPERNVNWRLRSMAAEARVNARPHWDEAWFMLGLLALASFHGLTMLPFWENWILSLARFVGDSGRLLVSFSLSFAGILGITVGLYCAFVYLTRWLAFSGESFRTVFSNFSFALLPIAFSYHICHNLGHLLREGKGLERVILNPLGTDPVGVGVAPPDASALCGRFMNTMVPGYVLHGIQATIMVWGFWITIKILRHRGYSLLGEGGDGVGWRLSFIIMFVSAATVLNVWLLMQDMVMRM